MNFIDDFNTVFDACILHTRKLSSYSEEKFLKASYLWVSIGWLLSLVVFIAGYLAKHNSEKLVTVFVVSFIVIILKGITDVTSSKKESATSLMIISIPLISYFIENDSFWISILAFYFPAMMMGKSLSIAIQSKKFNIGDGVVVRNLLISFVTFFTPVYIIFYKNISINSLTILSAYLAYIFIVAITALIKNILNKKDDSILTFSTFGILVVLLLNKFVMIYALVFLRLL